jgi:hypothetical protein
VNLSNVVGPGGVKQSGSKSWKAKVQPAADHPWRKAKIGRPKFALTKTGWLQKFLPPPQGNMESENSPQRTQSNAEGEI